MPLDSSDEDSIGFVLSHLDNILCVERELVPLICADSTARAKCAGRRCRWC